MPGKTNWNVAPGPAWPEADSRPPWDSTIDRQIDRPMPMPSDLVVKKASNSRLAFPAVPNQFRSLYRRPEFACFVLTRPDRQLASPVGDRLHRFDAVDDEIEDDLLQLDPIAEHGTKGRGELHSQRYPVAGQF